MYSSLVRRQLVYAIRHVLVTAHTELQACFHLVSDYVYSFLGAEHGFATIFPGYDPIPLPQFMNYDYTILHNTPSPGSPLMVYDTISRLSTFLSTTSNLHFSASRLRLDAVTPTLSTVEARTFVDFH